MLLMTNYDYYSNRLLLNQSHMAVNSLLLVCRSISNSLGGLSSVTVPVKVVRYDSKLLL